jgi:hypothetical protein
MAATDGFCEACGWVRGARIRFVYGNANMSPDFMDSLFSLLIGFALAGALTSGYQWFADRPPGFSLLQEGAVPKTFATVPFLVFAAPFIIMRNTVLGRKIESRRIQFVMIATVIAGFWSMMCGSVFIRVLEISGLFA